jgi:hypothetical protein
MREYEFLVPFSAQICVSLRNGKLSFIKKISDLHVSILECTLRILGTPFNRHDVLEGEKEKNQCFKGIPMYFRDKNIVSS